MKQNKTTHSKFIEGLKGTKIHSNMQRFIAQMVKARVLPFHRFSVLKSDELTKRIKDELGSTIDGLIQIGDALNCRVISVALKNNITHSLPKSKALLLQNQPSQPSSNLVVEELDESREGVSSDEDTETRVVVSSRKHSLQESREEIPEETKYLMTRNYTMRTDYINFFLKQHNLLDAMNDQYDIYRKSAF